MQLPFPVEASILAILPLSTARKFVQRHTTVAPPISNRKNQRIFVDVSVFAKHDAGTGIQRVVREVLNHLTKNLEKNSILIPIAASKRGSYCRINLSQIDASGIEKQGPNPVSLTKGDIFLGLDLAAHILPRHHNQLLKWKRAGASIQVVVYDLLPALHPQWFNPQSARNHKKWLKTLAIFSDRFHCISFTVKSDLLLWFKTKYNISLPKNAAHVFPLGSNLESKNTINKKILQADISAHEAIDFVRKAPTFLIVGTIEPRKGHAEVLQAFEDAWKKGFNYQLLVVGAPGWKTDMVQKKLLSASKENTKLLWLRDAQDSLLTQIYKSVAGVIVASEGEGYGLPLIEAAFFGRPVLARDIPVFREISQGSVTFFPKDPSQGLTAESLILWMISCETQKETTLNFNPPSWEASAKVLLSNMTQ